VRSKEADDGTADSDDSGELCIQNEELMAGMFETVVLLWMGPWQNLKNQVSRF